MFRVGRFVRLTAIFSLTLMFMALAVGWSSGGHVHADAAYTFSGVLSDQNGSPLSSTTVTLTGASGGVASVVTNGSGAFSINATPDTYYLTLSSSNTSGMSFTVHQSSTAPSIDLTTSNVTQNLRLPLAAVNFTTYTAQGYLSPSSGVTAASSTTLGSAVSLYPGDPGETYVQVTNTATLTSNAQGVGSFTSVIGANYSGGICDYDSSSAQIGCNTTPLTVGGGTNAIDVPHTPLARNTFSGVLADQHGNPLVGVSLSLSDAYGNTTSTTTGAGGAYSMAVEPGMYLISNLSGTNVGGLYLLGLKQTGTPSINLTGGNVTQNLTLPVTTVSYTAYDVQGHLNATGVVDAGSAYNAASSVSLYPGDPGEWGSINTGPLRPNSQGTGSFSTLVGVVYGANTICDFTASNTLIGCNATAFTATSGTNVVAIPAPLAPTNLTASSPTTEPSLSWTASPSASSYGVYRDGVKVGTVSTTSFMDNNVSGGAHAYYVTALDGVGNESAPSNTVNVTVNLVVPTLGTPTFSVSPVVQGQSTTVTVVVQGNLYGILGGEYYLGSTDPGQGHGIAMTYNNGTLSVVLSGLAVGNQTIHIRAQNGSGWSSLVSATVTVVKPTFSGVLTDSNGAALVGVTIVISDVHGNTGSATTSATGAFSIAVAPGMYYISSMTASNIEGMWLHNMSQSSATPSINLVAGNIVQNLVLPVSTVNYTAYTPQGYVYSNGKGISYTGTLTGVSLYAGDPGETLMVINATKLSGYTGSIKVVTGTGYAFCALNANYGTNGCTSSTTVASGTNAIDIPNTPLPRNTFSGVLTDSNGAALAGVTITLTDAYGDSVSATTAANGSFSVAVEPGIYSLSVARTTQTSTGSTFIFTQSGAPTLNLTSGNLTQNLVVPTATVNYTIYDAQGYLLSGDGYIFAYGGTGTTTVSLYAGDPGETLSYLNYSVHGGATGSFTTMASAYYSSICSEDHGLHTLGCSSLTVASGTNTVSVPTPLPRNTFSGTLTDQNGNIITGANITLTDVYGHSVSGSVDGSGNFSVAVEPGKYLISSLTRSSGVSTDGLYNFTFSQSGTPSIDLTTGNVIKNLVIPTATVNYVNYTSREGYTSVAGTVTGLVSLYAGDPGETLTNESVSIYSATGTGTGSFSSIVGTVYVPGSICYLYTPLAGKQKSCAAGGLTVGSGPYYVDIYNVPNPTLSAASPTNVPVLTWTAVTYTTNYIIYRDNAIIGTTTGTSFTDTNVAAGSHTYKVNAVDSTGDMSPGSSANIRTVTVTANTPTLSTPGFSSNPIVAGQDTTVTAQVTGNTYGITGGEYFIGADPGQGSGTAMTYNNGVLTAMITGTTLGDQTVYVRAQNATGWSTVVSAVLHVLPASPTNLTATSPTTEPSLSWTAVSGVTSYDVYRDGTKIGSTVSTVYVDTTAPEGTHTYYVKAVDSAGDTSVASSTVSVVVEGVDQAVMYYTMNDGTTFSKESTASATGVSTQTDNPDGTVTVSINNASGYADSGFTTWTGTLADLPSFTVTGAGDPFGLNIWFDTDNDGSFFAWDSNGALTGLSGDTYGLSSGSTNGVLSVTGNTSFYMLDDGQSYTLAQLIAGDDPTSGINANTVVTIWIGVDVTSGSASTTINSIGALQQV